jgi:hypothetical protein
VVDAPGASASIPVALVIGTIRGVCAYAFTDT